MGEGVGWFGPDDGMLVMDLDGSGAIENMTEVFSEVFDGKSYVDSLSALASLDTNTDQVISAGDQQFNDILVWQDSDSDGVSAAPELSTLSDRGITSISLDAQSVSETLAGNRLDAVGTVTLTDETTSTFAEVTFVVDGAPTTFSLGGIISTSVTREESTDTAFVVDADTDGTTTHIGSTGASEVVTLDDLSIAEIIEAMEASSPSEHLPFAADTLTVTTSIAADTDHTNAETSPVESSTTDNAANDLAATESTEPESSEAESSEPQDNDVDGYAVYPSPGDAVVIASEPQPLAA